MLDTKKLNNRIDWFCANKINAFSPTISPAPKSVQRNEIESIYEGVRFFYDAGVEQIVVQRKYMGSYCDVYLQKNIKDTYFVSRNGYRLTKIDIEETLNASVALHNRFDWTNLQTVIIQCEMMPWSALGKSLIDNDFSGYLNVHKNHYEHLRQSGLYAKIKEAKNTDSYRKYIDYKTNHTEKEVKKFFPEKERRKYEVLNSFKILELSNYKKYIDMYAIQLEHFGKVGNIHFKAFNILKKVFSDGSEHIVNDNLSFREVNDDEYLHLPVRNEKELDRTIETVYEWFAALESENEEGILIKPRQAFVKNVPPALKVRNNNYLLMIYGLDFYENYAKYLERRKITKKIDCSVNDWMLNLELLKVKYADINSENHLLKNIIFDRIMSEHAEATLDSRL